VKRKEWLYRVARNVPFRGHAEAVRAGRDGMPG
jgi:hypothetical protein